MSDVAALRLHSYAKKTFLRVDTATEAAGIHMAAFLLPDSAEDEVCFTLMSGNILAIKLHSAAVETEEGVVSSISTEDAYYLLVRWMLDNM